MDDEYHGQGSLDHRCFRASSRPSSPKPILKQISIQSWNAVCDHRSCAPSLAHHLWSVLCGSGSLGLWAGRIRIVRPHCTAVPHQTGLPPSCAGSSMRHVVVASNISARFSKLASRRCFWMRVDASLSARSF